MLCTDIFYNGIAVIVIWIETLMHFIVFKVKKWNLTNNTLAPLHIGLTKLFVYLSWTWIDGLPDFIVPTLIVKVLVSDA